MRDPKSEMLRPEGPRPGRSRATAFAWGLFLLTFAFALIEGITAATMGRPVFDPRDWVEIWVFRGRPEYRAQYRAWRDNPVHVNSKDFEKPAYAPETVLAARRLLEAALAVPPIPVAFARSNFHAPFHSPGSHAPAIEFGKSPVRTVAEWAEPVRSALTALTAHRDYSTGVYDQAMPLAELVESEIEAGFSPAGHGYSAAGLLHQTVMPLAAAGALGLAEQGRHFEAAETCLAMMRATEIREIAPVVEHLIHVGTLGVCADLLRETVRKGAPPEVRTLVLERLWEGRSHRMAPDPENPVMVTDDLARLRRRRNQGLSDFNPEGRTGREIAAAVAEAEHRFLLEILVPAGQRGATDPAARKQVGLLEDQAWTAGVLGAPVEANGLWEWAGLKLAPVFFRPGAYLKMIPNDAELRARIRNSHLRVDLLMIELASSLFKHDHGRLPDSIEELVPDYLPEFPEPPELADAAASP